MKFRFGIRSILLLMWILGIVFSVTLWFGKERLKYSNALEAKFDKLGVGVSLSNFISPIPVLDEEKSDPTLMDLVLGDTKLVRSDPFFGQIRIDYDAARFLADSLATHRIKEIVFSKSAIDSDACCFFRNWRSVSEVAFYDVDIPESWKEGIIESNHVESLTLGAGSSGFSLSDIRRLSSLKQLALLNIKLDREEMESLIQSLPNTQISFMSESE